jgi:hypothetical protein
MQNIDYLMNGSTHSGQYMRSSWRGQDGIIGSMRAIPEILLIPLYHKIRIPFETVHDAVMYFDTYIEILRNRRLITLKERLLWDIFHMPRYLWRATASCKDKMVMDLLFDATDIEQANFVEYAIGYNQKVFKEVVSAAKALARLLPRMRSDWKVFQYFAELR